VALKFKFAIASDLHIALPHTIWQHPARFHLVEYSIPAFEEVLHQLANLDLDFLLLPGDLTQHGETENHRWLSARLAKLPYPVYVIAGNHDESKLLSQAFQRQADLKEGGLYFSRNWMGRTILFMDTSKYKVEAPQLAWAYDQLQQLKGDLVLFIHHPPLLVGMPFMDNNYALKDRNPLLDILSAYPGNIDVFCGHYHIDRTIRWKNLLVHVTPSCFFQIDSYAEDFKVDHYRIAFREITFLPELTISALHYL
jgi:Icc protein